jgi:hypothetical protein
MSFFCVVVAVNVFYDKSETWFNDLQQSYYYSSLTSNDF